jgi:molybdopterin/thiamine biosynthesis adenylyltransferase
VSRPNGVDHPQPHTATVLDDSDERDRRVLAALRADPATEFLDTVAQQRETLARLRSPDAAELEDEPPRWVHYPWRRTVVGVLGPRSFATLRLDRNRNLITAAEQARLSGLRVGVVGLSVGHVIAHTIAMQGVAGFLRLADFDELELSNLNRVPATLLDLGVNKAVIAARRIAELDPYLPVDALTNGLTTDDLDQFFDGLDIVIDECDSLDMKLVIREAARERGLPVLMSTADRGLLDVERFDLDAQLPILHGLLRGIDSAQLAGLSTRDKIPHMLRFVDIARSSARGAASMLEVNSTLTTWPQLAGEVVLGATAVVEGVRRIGLGEPLPSGRTRIDVAAALDELTPPAPPPELPMPSAVLEAVPQDAIRAVAAAAARAPSGGNTQPWRITTGADSVTVRIAPERSSRMDVGFRASAVALGASVFNARVAAAAVGHTADVRLDENLTDGCPLQATIGLSPGAVPGLAALYGPMLDRGTNRNLGTGRALDSGTAEVLRSVTDHEGATVRLITDRADIQAAGRLMAAADRVRYLTADLHREMISELRWPGDADPDTGIDILGLGIERNDLVLLEILRRPDVMAWLADWDAGSGLGDDTFDKVNSSSALAVVSIDGSSLSDYARGGAATEAVWIAAEQQGLGVQPMSPVFLYAHDGTDLADLSATFAEELHGLQTAFHRLAGTVGLRHALVLRLSDAPQPSTRSRREAYPRNMVEV